MSQIRIFHEQNTHTPIFVSEKEQDIINSLEKINVLFKRWHTNFEVSEQTTSEQILDIYQHHISQLQQQCGFGSFDVVHLFPDHPEKDTLRKKFLKEHIHSEDEIRFFIHGSGLFCLHVNAHVYVVQCEKNDLISVPTGIAHWFDAGIEPRFSVIRFFTHTEGWIANYTGNEIAQQFKDYPGHDQRYSY